MNAELDALARDLDRLPDKISKDIQPIFSKTALEIKNRMAADFTRSKHFSQVGPTIDYDIWLSGDFMEAEIGPNAATGGAASLAGIAYFGGSNGGGGTVREPDYILEDESDLMMKHILNAAGALWD